jgi:hypothetical protein
MKLERKGTQIPFMECVEEEENWMNGFVILSRDDFYQLMNQLFKPGSPASDKKNE